MTAIRLPSSPVDIEDIYFSHANLAPINDVRSTVYAELGGQLHSPVIDDELDELPLMRFAGEFVDDKRKRDIERGLGGLGLLVLSGNNIQAMNLLHQIRFAAAVSEYEARLSILPGLLRVEGSMDGGALRALYQHESKPVPDQRWANLYADRVVDLRAAVRDTDVFALASEIKAKHKSEVHKQLHKPGEPLSVVHTASRGKFVVVRAPASRSIRAA